MDAKTEKLGLQIAAAQRQHANEKQRMERDIHEVIKPLVRRITSLGVERRFEDAQYGVHLRVDERMLEFMRHSPESGLEAVGRDIAMQIIRKIEHEANRMKAI